MNIFEKSVLFLGEPIRFTCERAGNDLFITCFGGSHPHVGAVALAQAAENARMLECPGHKEAIVARMLAERSAKAVHATACACCGIHYDNLTREQIGAVVALCEDCCDELVDALEKMQNAPQPEQTR